VNQLFAILVCLICSLGCGNRQAGFGAVEFGYYNAKETVDSKKQKFDYRTKDRFLDYFKEECVFMLTPASCRANGDSLEITFPSESTREKYYLLGFIDSMASSEKIVLRRTGKNELTLRWKSADQSIVLERYALSGSK
jgi:hypothetical protein